jgi:hypothetical protein
MSGALPTATHDRRVERTPTMTVTSPEYQSLFIYDEKVDEAWTLENSRGFKYELQDMAEPHRGVYNLSATPLVDMGELSFTVRKVAAQSFLRDQVFGVNFWLYSGDDYIQTDDLLISVIGSNRYPYWVANDDSVDNVYEPVFSATRLYFLGINHDIPPETWVQVEIWLDDLQFDPVYKYVTGIVIKNDTGFRHTLVIDEVELIVLREEP